MIRSLLLRSTDYVTRQKVTVTLSADEINLDWRNYPIARTREGAQNANKPGRFRDLSQLVTLVSLNCHRRGAFCALSPVL
jgi:hypothetical protein